MKHETLHPTDMIKEAPPYLPTERTCVVSETADMNPSHEVATCPPWRGPRDTVEDDSDWSDSHSAVIGTCGKVVRSR